MRKRIILGALIILSMNMTAQDFSELDLQHFIEHNFQFQDEQLNYEELYESLLLLYSNPLAINSASMDELQGLYLLDNTQIQNFLDYRDEFGPLISFYELQAVPGFDIEAIRKLRPFVTVKERPADVRTLKQRVLAGDNGYFIFRTERTLESSEGFNLSDSNSNRYLGDRNKIYSRVRISEPKDFSLGLTLEKDPGEPLSLDFGERKYGVDYLSYHVIMHNKGRWKTVALGDYQLQYGQGLIFGAGFNPGKGSETITTIKRSDIGIRPYSSVLESGFFRGAATTYNFGKLELTGIFSRQFVDANVRSDSTISDLEEFISSIQRSGLHRNEKELDGRKQIKEQVFGSNIRFSSKKSNFKSGANFVYTSYGKPLVRSTRVYNQFEFTGRNNYAGSLYGNLLWQNLNFFGEAGISRSGGVGMVGGVVASLTRKASMSLVLRNYHRDFHSFYGNAFGESSRNINEEGIYWGLKFQPMRKVVITAYYDYFRFPWLKFRTEAPSNGSEYLVRFNFRASKKLALYAQYRQETKMRNSSADLHIRRISPGTKSNYLLNLDYRPGKSVSMRSRVQWSTFGFESNLTEGFAVIQDVNYEFGKLRLSTRFALFEADDFENRQFAYERDVLYAFSIPAYSGVGIRNYLLIQYKLGRKITCWLRLARTKRTDVNTTGSGSDRIDSNHKTDLKFQLRYKI